MEKSGIHITFEGGEGSGKSSQIKILADYLQSHQYNFIVVQNPGESKIGLKIREILLDPENSSISKKAEVFLHAASLNHNLNTIILPALKAGKIVISDRYIDSAIVYQGIARGVGIEFINKIILEEALDGSLPDLTIYIDIPETLVKERTEDRNKSESRIEEEPISFHKVIRNAYLELATKNPSRIKTIDGTQNVDKVSHDIILALSPYL